MVFIKRLFCVFDFCQLYLDEKWNSVLCGKLASQFLVTKPPEHDGYILYSNPMHQYAKEGNNLLVCLLAVVIRVSACASQKLSKYPWIFVQAEVSLPLQLLKTPLGVWLLLRLHVHQLESALPQLFSVLWFGGVKAAFCSHLNKKYILSLKPSPAAIKTKYFLHNKQNY